MRTKNKIPVTRKALQGLMLLGIFLTSFGVGNVPSARAQEAGPAPITKLVQATEPTFADVPFDHPMYKYIQALYDAGLTAGCSTDPLMFCPDTIMDRAQSAVFMMRGQFGSGYTPPAAPWPTFVADDWTGFEWAQPWAEGMYQAGLTAGCQADPLKYCPATQLTRVEASVFGLKMKYGEAYLPPPATFPLFADMTDQTFWGTAWAERAFQEGILLSCGNQNGRPMFCPHELVDRGWGAYLIVKAKGLIPENVPAITEYMLPPSSYPVGITLGPDGALWFADRGSNQIGRITTSGTISEFPLPSWGSDVWDITPGPDGALWFAANDNQIGRITTTGEVTQFQVPITSSGNPIYSITSGPDGALWFTVCCIRQGLIGRITTAGAVTKFPLSPDSNATDITSGPDGALWFTDRGKIGRITTLGVITYFPLPTGASTYGIALGPDGALWFTEMESNMIGRITTTGIITEFPIPTPISGPLAIVAGSDNALWFTEYGSNQIGRITMTGVVTEYLIPTTGEFDGFPYGIALGSDDALWFAERLGPAIGRITVP